MDWTDRIRMRDLRLFVSLCRTQNISRTARETNRSQPGISRWLRDLEAEIGSELFYRTGKGLTPTPHGLALLQHATRIGAAIDIARDDMEIRLRQGEGIVTVGITGASSADALPIGIVQLLRESPDIHFRLRENSLEILSAGLVDGTADVLIAQSGVGFDPDIVRAEHLYDDPICMVARAGHPLAGKELVTWADIVAYPLVLWAEDTPMRQGFNQALAERGLSLPATFIESNSTSITLNMLFNSNMVALALLSPSRRYEALDLLMIVPLDFGASGSVSMYWNKAAANRTAVRKTMEAIRTAVRERLPFEGEWKRLE
jgi:DNA-binding transcriptional LysR family regulator